MLIKLIKFPFKLFVLPLILICTTVALLVKLAANLSCYVLGPLMLFLLGCGIYTITKQQWSQTILLALMEVACVAVLFGAVLIETALDSVNSALIGFLHS